MYHCCLEEIATSDFKEAVILEKNGLDIRLAKQAILWIIRIIHSVYFFFSLRFKVRFLRPAEEASSRRTAVSSFIQFVKNNLDSSGCWVFIDCNALTRPASIWGSDFSINKGSWAFKAPRIKLAIILTCDFLLKLVRETLEFFLLLELVYPDLQALQPKIKLLGGRVPVYSNNSQLIEHDCVCSKF